MQSTTKGVNQKADDRGNGSSGVRSRGKPGDSGEGRHLDGRAGRIFSSWDEDQVKGAWGGVGHMPESPQTW